MTKKRAKPLEGEERAKRSATTTAANFAISKIRRSSQQKEFLLHNTNGPHSLPNEHYPKSFLIRKEKH